MFCFCWRRWRDYLAASRRRTVASNRSRFPRVLGCVLGEAALRRTPCIRHWRRSSSSLSCRQAGARVQISHSSKKKTRQTTRSALSFWRRWRDYLAASRRRTVASNRSRFPRVLGCVLGEAALRRTPCIRHWRRSSSSLSCRQAGARVQISHSRKKDKADLMVCLIFLAEMERFELSRRYYRPTPLAGAPLRPLEYISVFIQSHRAL